MAEPNSIFLHLVHLAALHPPLPPAPPRPAHHEPTRSSAAETDEGGHHPCPHRLLYVSAKESEGQTFTTFVLYPPSLTSRSLCSVMKPNQNARPVFNSPSAARATRHVSRSVIPKPSGQSSGRHLRCQNQIRPGLSHHCRQKS